MTEQKERPSRSARSGEGGRRPASRAEPPPGLEELRQRLRSSLEQMLELASPSAVSEALEAPTGFDSLPRLLDDLLQEHPEMAVIDPELRSDLELMRARRDVVRRAGGAWTTPEAAEHLNVTPEAVRKRVQRGRLLAYRTPSGEHRLPLAQFTESGTVEGLEEVLEAMAVEDGWMRVQLFLDDDVLGNLREGRLEEAVEAARSYLPRERGRDEG